MNLYTMCDARKRPSCTWTPRVRISMWLCGPIKDFSSYWYIIRHTKKRPYSFPVCGSSNVHSMRSPLFGQQTCFLPESSSRCLWTAKALVSAHTCSLAWAFAGCLCHKYPFLVCWLIYWYTVFDLITTHTPISAQPSNSDYNLCTFCLLVYKGICFGYKFE